MTLKKINYSGYLSEVLKWEANLSAALLYNYPQILAFIQRYSDKNSATSNSHQLAPLMEEIKITFENLKNHADIKHYIKNKLSKYTLIDSASGLNHIDADEEIQEETGGKYKSLSGKN